MTDTSYLELYCNQGYIGRFDSEVHIEAYLKDSPVGLLDQFSDFKYRTVRNTVSEFTSYEPKAERNNHKSYKNLPALNPRLKAKT